MAPDDEQPALLPSLEGNPAANWSLRRSLQILQESNQNPEFTNMISDVLAGKVALRDIADSSTFTSAVFPLASAAAEQAPLLSTDELEAQAAQATEELEAEYAAAQRATEVAVETDDDTRSDEEYYEETVDHDDDDRPGNSSVLDSAW